MRMALGNLAEIIGDPDMASLDPLCSLSFSCLTQDVIQGQSDLLKHYFKGQASALNPESPLRTCENIFALVCISLTEFI